jgi:integrase
LPSKKTRLLKSSSGRAFFIKRFGKPLEEFSSFKRATEGLGARTFDAYRKILPHYFLFIDEDPDSVIVQRKKDIASDDVTENERYERKTTAFLKVQLANGISGGSTGVYLGRVQGFFANNGKRLSLDMRRLKLPKARKHRKYSPSNEDVRVLFSKADCARDRLIVALMYQNGPVPIDVSLLTVGDYPEVPWVYFERSRSKTGEIWRGISTPDVCECLRVYLNVRGNVKVGEPLFVGREGVLDNDAISQVIRELLLKVGFNNIKGFKPTSLRDAFEDALVDAETYVKVKEAFMGHTSDIQHEYGSQDKMEFRLVEAMKKVYPLVCLNDSYKSYPLAGFSVEDTEKVKKLLERFDDFMAVAELAKKGKILL